MRRLAIITTHPIQYNAPLFEILSSRRIIDIKVFYTWGESVMREKYDPGFGRVISWDIPLLQGYNYTFLENAASDAGSHHFKGIQNPGIVDAVNEYKPSAILVYGWSFASHLRIMRYYKGKIPIFFRGDSTLLDETYFYKRILRSFVLKFVYRHIDYALYVGKNNYRYFIAAGIKKDQLIYAPHAIDNDRFRCDNISCLEKVQALRIKLGLQNSSLVFLFAGKLEEKKNPELLLEAFLKCAFPKDVHLVVVGNGAQESRLRAKYSGISNVRFLDFQNQMEMPAVYGSADVFVLPSRGPGETWGLSVNEAMASGKAVIVSDKCGSAPDLVEEGMNGYLFDSGNLQQLTETLQKIFARRSEVKQMGEYSRQKIKGFSLLKVATTLEDLMTRITLSNSN